MKDLRDEPRDRIAGGAHFIFLVLLILGISVWIFRTYAFEPLHLRSGTEVGSP